MSQPIPTPAAAPPAEAKKSKKKGCIMAGCGGCLLVFVSCCGFGGYLTYLEEGVSYSDPGDEVASQPMTSGVPFEAFIEAEWTNYAHIRTYVDLGPGAAPGTRVSGEMGCMEYGELRPRPVDEEFYGSRGDVPAGWLRVHDDYRRSDGRPMQCRGTFTILPPVPGARLVFTKRQRPSDWAAF